MPKVLICFNMGIIYLHVISFLYINVEQIQIRKFNFKYVKNKTLRGVGFLTGF